MANQSPDRRKILEMLAITAGVSQFPCFSRWSFAAELPAEHIHQHAPAPKRAATYQPQFFNVDDYALVDHLSEMIIPQTETPGAHSAGVSEFIDHMAAHDLSLQERWRSALSRLQDQARRAGAAEFLRLDPSKQQAILQSWSVAPSGSADRQAFQLLRTYTVMGFYTSRIGLAELDYPGLKAYVESPSCPHVNDRAHLHLHGGNA